MEPITGGMHSGRPDLGPRSPTMDASPADAGPKAGAADRFRRHAEICRVLTDPKRLALLHALRGGERSVGDLALGLGCALPNASQHLGVLRAAGLVDARRSGTTVLYRLSEPDILAACDVVDRIVLRRLSADPGRHAAAPDERPPGHVHPEDPASRIATTPRR